MEATPLNKRKGFSNGLKKKVLMRDGYICRYCGDRASTVDHVIPVCFVPMHQESNLVAACSKCNCKLGSRYFPTFDEKRMFLLENMRTNKKEIPVWTRGEIRSLGHVLRSYVEGNSVVVEDEKQLSHVEHYLGKMGLSLRRGRDLDMEG